MQKGVQLLDFPKAVRRTFFVKLPHLRQGSPMNRYYCSYFLIRSQYRKCKFLTFFANLSPKIRKFIGKPYFRKVTPFAIGSPMNQYYCSYFLIRSQYRKCKFLTFFANLSPKIRKFIGKPYFRKVIPFAIGSPMNQYYCSYFLSGSQHRKCKK